ncbi:hypothetical protein P3T76_009897 [Phytophthora citrophthora]|uniref:Uncharacterized protein n=1 Tax=Phytophthora citrophthora TaxID=4793 RepID=A0AAD9LIY0_9STRA|nr:hypothetical protein P3T76_009897 [Phytophthora citrophthora]
MTLLARYLGDGSLGLRSNSESMPREDIRITPESNMDSRKASVAFIMNSSENVHMDAKEPSSSTSITKRKARECKVSGCENYIINKGLAVRSAQQKVVTPVPRTTGSVGDMVAGSSVKWKDVIGEASREVSAGRMVVAPSALTRIVLKWQSQMVCAGLTAVANDVYSKAVRKLRMNVTTTTARITLNKQSKQSR